MSLLLFFAAFCSYSFFVYRVKRALYPFDKELTPRPLVQWQPGHEHALIVSPDYWWAFRFKSRISPSVALTERAEILRSFVIRNNRFNVVISAIILSLCLASAELAPSTPVFFFFATFAGIRFISRSYEITYAFVCDVLQQRPSTTELNKNARIRLAILSYLEIYLYSAAAYTALPTVKGGAEAITLALNVGTLTNVGYAFSKECTPFIVNVVFIQVITTLSLVVLSLAAYLSRDDA